MKAGIVAVAVFVTLSVGFAQMKKPVAPAGKGNPEHGRYIAENVAMCIQCHTPREANGELMRSKVFEGASIPVGKPQQLNVWAEFAPRIAGLPQYSEEQMIRLLTSGIGREEKPLRPPMPTFKMSPQDAGDVVAYLKTMK